MVSRRQPPSARPPRTEPTDPSEKERRALIDATVHANSLLIDLGLLLPEPSGRGPTTGTIGRHAPESSEPWNAEAADAYWRIWFGVRKLANHFQRLCEQPAIPWGAADTTAAFTTVRNLASAVPGDDLALARRKVDGWITAARRIRDIDEEDEWTPVPRAPGMPAPLCPYCRTLSLRMAKARETVRCFFPECRDLDGRPTQARMEPGRMTGTGTLVFGDGTIVSYRGDHDET